MLVSEFDFDLPEELIAQYPAPRGASRLLVLDRASGGIQHATVADLPRFLRHPDLLVVNDTRVFSARLLGRRIPSGGRVECLLLEAPVTGRDGSATVDALMHPGQKLKPGARVRFEREGLALDAEVLAQKFFGRRTVRLTAEPGESIEGLIEQLGHVPLPPYIKRHDLEADRERYQTVFATATGSVAAPTAGLHFTPELLQRLGSSGVERVSITLHVGYGTFKPVRSEEVERHVVDPEHYEIGREAAERLDRARQEGRRIVAVGTTTTRALEDAARRQRGRVAAGRRQATAFIYPGFEFRVVDALLTNFHLPRSSLLMLVAAFAGRERVLSAYRTAIEHGYRFYSYGDAMLIV